MAHALIGKWTGADAERANATHINLETEHRITILDPSEGPSLCRIDLAMSRDGAFSATLWIEIKRALKTESSEGQVLRYANHLNLTHKQSGRALGIVYLTDIHASSLDSSEFPDSVKYTECTWRELFDVLGEFKDEPAVADFRRYLEEAGLALRAIDGDDIRMLEESLGSRMRMEQMLEAAHARIVERCSDEYEIEPGRQGPKFKTWADHWGEVRTYANCLPRDGGSPGLRENLLLEWNLRRREGLDEYRDGQVLFAAGLTWPEEEGDAELARAPVLGALHDRSEVDFFEYRDDRPRICRFLDPEELVKGSRSIHGQAEALAEFVMVAYDAILDALEELDRASG